MFSKEVIPNQRHSVAYLGTAFSRKKCYQLLENEVFVKTGLKGIKQSQHFFKFYNTFIPIQYITVFNFEMRYIYALSTIIRFYLINGFYVDTKSYTNIKSTVSLWDRILPSKVEYGHKEMKRFMDQNKSRKKYGKL